MKNKGPNNSDGGNIFGFQNGQIPNQEENLFKNFVQHFGGYDHNQALMKTWVE